MKETASDGGRKPRVDDDGIRKVFRSTDDPVLSTREVAEELPIKRRGTLDRLQSLESDGDLQSKQIGGRSKVWWLTVEGQTPDMDEGLPSADSDVTRDTVDEGGED
jgi:hypothetical protein